MTLCVNPAQGQAPLKSFDAVDGVVIGVGAAVDLGLRLIKSKKPPAKELRTRGAFEQTAINNLSLTAKKHSDIILRGFTPAATVGSHFLYDDPERSIYLNLQAIIITDVANLLAKKLIQRARPFTYRPDLDHNIPGCKAYNKEHPDANLSFYSGHTSHVASFVFFANSMLWFYKPEYRSHGWAWIVSGLLPAAVGYQRVMAGKHFPSDVMAGYLIGAAVGYMVPRFHENDSYESDLTSDFLVGLGAGLLAQYALIRFVGKNRKVKQDCCPDRANRIDWNISPTLGPYSGLKLSLRFN